MVLRERNLETHCSLNNFNSTLLFVTEDQEKGTSWFMIPAQIKGCVGICFCSIAGVVTFSDNNLKVVGWCSSARCLDDCSGHPGKCCEGFDLADDSIDFHNLFENESECMCEYARLLYIGLGSDLASLWTCLAFGPYKHITRRAILKQNWTCLVKAHELHGKHYTIVRTDSKFKHWGIVEHKEFPNGRSWGDIPEPVRVKTPKIVYIRRSWTFPL